jgi:hypothetical protein
MPALRLAKKRRRNEMKGGRGSGIGDWEMRRKGEGEWREGFWKFDS